MGTEHQYFSCKDGKITGHISFQTIDATFRHNGQKVNMYFHRYLGPSFYLLEDGEERDFYPDEAKEFAPVWDQFHGWWKAKGREIYG